MLEQVEGEADPDHDSAGEDQQRRSRPSPTSAASRATPATRTSSNDRQTADEDDEAQHLQDDQQRSSAPPRLARSPNIIEMSDRPADQDAAGSPAPRRATGDSRASRARRARRSRHDSGGPPSAPARAAPSAAGWRGSRSSSGMQPAPSSCSHGGRSKTMNGERMRDAEPHRPGHSRPPRRARWWLLRSCQTNGSTSTHFAGAADRVECRRQDQLAVLRRRETLVWPSSSAMLRKLESARRDGVQLPAIICACFAPSRVGTRRASGRPGK